ESSGRIKGRRGRCASDPGRRSAPPIAACSGPRPSPKRNTRGRGIRPPVILRAADVFLKALARDTRMGGGERTVPLVRWPHARVGVSLAAALVGSACGGDLGGAKVDAGARDAGMTRDASARAPDAFVDAGTGP